MENVMRDLLKRLMAMKNSYGKESKVRREL